MKRYLLIAFSVMLSVSMFAQCDELFFSEYVEGSHNNKALEIYNPTNAPINLNGYSIARYSNGGSNAQSRLLEGVIQPADVYVVVLDKQDPNGTGYDTIVFDELRAIADTFISGVYPGPMFFNGNDAVTLEKNGAYVDMIGVIGQDPGVAWTCDTTAGFTDLNGGRWMTANHTLIRKKTVQKGVTANPNFFNPCAQWDSLPINTFTYLGWHNGDCTPNGIDAPLEKHDAFLFPNPVKNSTFMVKANDMIRKVEVINVIGQTIFSEENSVVSGEMKVNTNDFSDGLYMVRIIFDDNSEVLKKIVIE